MFVSAHTRRARCVIIAPDPNGDCHRRTNGRSQRLRTRARLAGTRDMWTEIIGWSAATILLLTISRQVYTQWRERTTQGLSKWLFVGQLAASTGFVIYSWLLGNWVFVVTNVLMLVTAAGGQWIFMRNRRREERAAATHPKRGSSQRARSGA